MRIANPRGGRIPWMIPTTAVGRLYTPLRNGAYCTITSSFAIDATNVTGIVQNAINKNANAAVIAFRTFLCFRLKPKFSQITSLG